MLRSPLRAWRGPWELCGCRLPLPAPVARAAHCNPARPCGVLKRREQKDGASCLSLQPFRAEPCKSFAEPIGAGLCFPRLHYPPQRGLVPQRLAFCAAFYFFGDASAGEMRNRRALAGAPTNTVVPYRGRAGAAVDAVGVLRATSRDAWVVTSFSFGIFLGSHKTLRNCDSRSESGAFCAFMTVLFRPVADSLLKTVISTKPQGP